MSMSFIIIFEEETKVRSSERDSYPIIMKPTHPQTDSSKIILFFNELFLL